MQCVQSFTSQSFLILGVDVRSDFSGLNSNKKKQRRQ